MKEGPDIARIAALIGDPARANILTALMAGKALTASELAQEAGVSLQTASAHLAKLDQGGLIAMRKSGRHKYFRLAGDEVAGVLEALMGLAAGTGHLRTRTGPRDAAMRRARVCYNHLAGEMGVRMYAAMLDRGYLRQEGEALALTPAGADFVASLGIDLGALPRSKAPLCRECLDWSARQSHLAGQLGRAMLSHFIAQGWARREEGSRVVRFGPAGEAAFDRLFGAAEPA
ncbi:ArsR/SmtB family transcription factor [Thalassovita mangrovi]|uniref:Metalloregulator ArsR/SmtB family transcription factor n=1 Tax=Thalassovita mangrovi TaxID=2692236 RepID=A0A6L8LR29_9RHOB|nr:winged helix-turn-helix domain-containing protein [Thalassovita mangrovi]MYM55629.1 metalloregulator ArsR/SmtB family transcription factor [Thalassovita mangrovi]